MDGLTRGHMLSHNFSKFTKIEISEHAAGVQVSRRLAAVHRTAALNGSSHYWQTAKKPHS